MQGSRGNRFQRSSGTGARGRIAEVLAQARASLKEPSRPFTPASLDARVDEIHENNQIPQKKTTKTSFIYDNIFFSDAPVQRTSTDTSPKHSAEINILLLDISDQLQLLGVELEASQLDLTSLLTVLTSLSQSIEKYIKALKAGAVGSDAMQRTNGSIYRALSRIIDEAQTKELRQFACRIILKLHLTKYPQDELNMTDARLLLRVCRDMYLTATSPWTATETSVDDVMLQGGIDLITELISIVWIQVRTLFNTSTIANVDTAPAKLFLEAAVYASGVIRAYSTEEINRRRLIHINTMQILGEGFDVVKTIYSIGNEHEPILLSQLGNVIVQIIATFRNFSLDNGGRSVMLKHGSICSICDILIYYPTNAELLLNCVRVTAKLSLLEPFRSQLNKHPTAIASLVQIVLNEAEGCRKVMEGEAAMWPAWYTWPLLSRAAFTLGNLTTTNDSNRELIALQCKCIRPLLTILQTCGCSLMALFSRQSDADETHSREDSFSEEEEDDDHGDDAGVDINELSDATVKLLRLLANLAINEQIGVQLTNKRDTLKMLLELLACSSIGEEHEELQLNVVASCTNITFYSCKVGPAEAGSKDTGLESMALRLLNCLFHTNDELVLEAARALGNLTRCEYVIEALCHNKALDAMILLLDHANFDILTAVTGTLVNISAHTASLSCLMESSHPAQALITVLKRSSMKNLRLSTLVCQVFHNLLLHGDKLEPSLQNTLLETMSILVECAQDYNEDAYCQFVAVGRLVLEILHEQCSS